MLMVCLFLIFFSFMIANIEHFISKDAMRLFSILLSRGGDVALSVPNSEVSYGPKLPCIIKLE